MAELDIAAGAVVGVELDLDGDGETSVKSREKSHDRRDHRPTYVEVASAVGQGSVAGTPVFLNFGGPASGRIWDIRQLVSFGTDDRTQGQNSSQTAVAAAANVLTLPAGQALTGFVLSTSGVPPVTGVLTVTGGAGGTLSYQITEQAGGEVNTFTFSPPLMPATPGGSIVINFPAIVSGGASAITATTVLPIAWYKANSDPTTSNPPMLPNLLVPGTRFIPDTVQPASAESTYVKFREILVAVVYGVPANSQVGGVVRVADWADTVPEARWVR